jgi:hypothetical protein
MESAGETLQGLSSARHQGWNHFLTEDESWLYSNTDYVHILHQRNGTRPVREKRIVGSRQRRC